MLAAAQNGLKCDLSGQLFEIPDTGTSCSSAQTSNHLTLLVIFF